MLIRYGYEFAVQCTQPTPMIVMVSAHPDHAGDHVGPETHRLSPSLPTTAYVDVFGNVCRRFIAPTGLLTLTGEGLLHDDAVLDPIVPDARQHDVADLPDDTLIYLMGSRYCETDRLSQIAWNMFGNTPPGWARVQAVCDYVHDHIHFNYNDARATRTAMEAWQEGRGVCRDFAHLAITFCRCLNIPARYVNGHLGDIGVPFSPDPMDYAAWMEVYLGGAWHTFDPRNNQRRIGRIVVARGRDATDVPMITSFGQHLLTQFRVICEEVEGGIGERNGRVARFSTASLRHSGLMNGHSGLSANVSYGRQNMR